MLTLLASVMREVVSAVAPLIATALALALGAAAALGEDALRQGLGLVALIAVAPVVSVTALGLLFRRKRKEPQS